MNSTGVLNACGTSYVLGAFACRCFERCVAAGRCACASCCSISACACCWCMVGALGMSVWGRLRNAKRGARARGGCSATSMPSRQTVSYYFGAAGPCNGPGGDFCAQLQLHAGANPLRYVFRQTRTAGWLMLSQPHGSSSCRYGCTGGRVLYQIQTMEGLIVVCCAAPHVGLQLHLNAQVMRYHSNMTVHLCFLKTAHYTVSSCCTAHA